jgi:hypothetical protein
MAWSCLPFSQPDHLVEVFVSMTHLTCQRLFSVSHLQSIFFICNSKWISAIVQISGHQKKYILKRMRPEKYEIFYKTSNKIFVIII